MDSTSSSIAVDATQLIDKIMRIRIRESRYFKEKCFGLNEATLVDRAVELNYVGGMAGEREQPSPFICLLLKLLEMKPGMDIMRYFIHDGGEEFKYMRCLGSLYLRLTGAGEVIYDELEPLYADYRKIAMHTRSSWELTTVDQFVENLLKGTSSCDVVFPRLLSRKQLVSMGRLKTAKRDSLLRELFESILDNAEAKEFNDVL